MWPARATTQNGWLVGHQDIHIAFLCCLTPHPVCIQVQDLCSRLSVVVGEDGLSKEAQRNATIMFMSLLRANLASKRILRVGGLSKAVD